MLIPFFILVGRIRESLSGDGKGWDGEGGEGHCQGTAQIDKD